MNGKKILVLMVVILVTLLAALPAGAQGKDQTQGGGINVTCNNGANIVNGVEVVVNMRSGFTYTATAIGVGDFDPVLAVLDDLGQGLCADDDIRAASYAANLPTSGAVRASTLSSHVPFSQNGADLANVSLVVGSYDGTSGEFLLVLEGMAVTSYDGSGVLAGDPFFVRLTQNMIDSGVPLSVYMIAETSDLDPLMRIVDTAGNVLLECDDAGSATCSEGSQNLTGYSITRSNGALGGFQYDAMISLDLAGLELNANPDENYLEYRFTSYNQGTFGDYVAVFHIGYASGEIAPNALNG